MPSPPAGPKSWNPQEPPPQGGVPLLLVISHRPWSMRCCLRMWGGGRRLECWRVAVERHDFPSAIRWRCSRQKGPRPLPCEPPITAS